MRRNWFVSYAYNDSALLGELKCALPDNVRAIVQKLLCPSRHRQISDVLLRKIRRSVALVYPDIQATRDSPWCVMERDYARRSGKDVWKYSPEIGALTIDTRPAMDLNGILLAPYYARAGHKGPGSVEWLLRGLRERHFDILSPQELNLSDQNWRAELAKVFGDTRCRTGFVAVAFSGQQSENILWEFEAVRRMIGPARILVACLENCPTPRVWRDALEESDLPIGATPFIQLWTDKAKSATNRLDDFIVAAYSLFRESVVIGTGYQ